MCGNQKAEHGNSQALIPVQYFHLFPLYICDLQLELQHVKIPAEGRAC